jgi:hypothetical protein
MGRKISASLFGAHFADSPLERERLDDEDRDAKRVGDNLDFCRNLRMLQGFPKLESPF